MTSQHAPVIEVSHLRKVYRSRRGHADLVAVADLSFNVQPGTAMGIVGGSGAGKTTIASLLMGFERPTAGSIRINGTPRPPAPRRADRKHWARQIQIVFQDPYHSLDPRQPIGHALDEVLRHHFHLDRAQRDKRITDLLDSVGLAATHRTSLPRALSGGQRQRVVIARALAVQPRILILDESVAALDVSIQAQVLNLLNDLRTQLGITYLVISHDLGVIRYCTDHILVMRRGELIEHGGTRTVLDAPSHEYTATLRDSIPHPGWQPKLRTAT